MLKSSGGSSGGALKENRRSAWRKKGVLLPVHLSVSKQPPSQSEMGDMIFFYLVAPIADTTAVNVGL